MKSNWRRERCHGEHLKDTGKRNEKTTKINGYLNSFKKEKRK